MANDIVSWQNESNVRGTWSIISSCVATLVLCVYTAVHIDVPHVLDSRKKRNLTLLYWVLAGIFAPELVVWTAWCQWSDAKSLMKRVERLRSEIVSGRKTGADTNALRDLLSSWTLKHSFLVVMGGFQFRPAAVDEKFWSREKPCTVIDRDSFLFLIENGYASVFPVLSTKDIADRSKADGFAKLLSCLQGGWLMFQLLGRTISHLTITELEVNTFAHTCCAIAMYAFWMSKPLNVQQPVYVDASGLEYWLVLHHAHSRFMIEALRRCTIGEKVAPSSTSTRRQLHSDIEWVDAHQHQDLASLLNCVNYRNRIELGEMAYASNADWDLAAKMLSTCRSLSGQGCTLEKPCIDCHISQPINSDLENAKKAEAVSATATPLKEYTLLRDNNSMEVLNYLWGRPDPDNMLQKYSHESGPVHNVSMIPVDARTTGLLELLGLALISSIYGGLHACLWNHHFPNAVEMWVWRVSSLTVAGNGLLLVPIFFVTWNWGSGNSWIADKKESFKFNARRGWRRWSDLMKEIVNRDLEIPQCIWWLFIAAFYAVQAAFVFSRMFLVVEAFISLRSQPAAVYRTPQWTQWLPHL